MGGCVPWQGLPTMALVACVCFCFRCTRQLLQPWGSVTFPGPRTEDEPCVKQGRGGDGCPHTGQLHDAGRFARFRSPSLPGLVMTVVLVDTFVVVS